MHAHCRLEVVVSPTTTRVLCGWWRWLEWTLTCYAGPCTCLLVLSSGPEDHLAAVKKLQEEGRARCVCLYVWHVCECVCVDVQGAWLEQTLCGSSNAALPYPVARPISDAGHTAPSAGPSCPAGRVSQVSILACMRIKALV